MIKPNKIHYFYDLKSKRNMKISFNWLSEYIKHNETPESLDQILTDTGLEVEGVEKIEGAPGGFQGLVVGEVLTCEQHPDADRLRVTTVNIGAEEVLQIVCGAPNVAVGQKVIVATVGTTLYPTKGEPFKIKRSKIRGVESVGMICAEDEIGLGKSHDGIMVLDKNAKVGTPAAEYFDIQDDYVLEIGLTPNRADAMGHIGVARDIRAFLNTHRQANIELQWPVIKDFTVNPTAPVKIEVANTSGCPRYCGLTIDGIQIQASPEWLQQRLRAIGLSPINNVVDVTNYVMHELGTPLHAFDARVVAGHLVVRNAKQDEVLITLDGIERKLHADDLVIANADEAMCIAGVFGGQKSGVSEKTTAIFLESAVFDAVTVRRTARRHGLNTEASFRFERGVDPELTMYALKRAAQLIIEVAGGHIASEPQDLMNSEFKPTTLDFSISACNRLIGMELEASIIEKILKNLDFRILNKSGDIWTLSIPLYRVDVKRQADVVEEILRIYGFNHVPMPEKLNTSLSYTTKPDPEAIRNKVANFLVANGCFEIMNNSLTKSAYITAEKNKFLVDAEMRKKQLVHILNPLSSELDVMRQTLVFGVLETISYNQNRQCLDAKVFEFGKIYFKNVHGYTEENRLMLAITGNKKDENWTEPTQRVSFFTLKGLVNSFMTQLGIAKFVAESVLENASFLEDGVSLILNKNQTLGELGWISNATKKHFGIKQDVFIADLNWDVILSAVKMNKVTYQELPKTFAVRRDFSLLLPKEARFADIAQIATKADNKILKEVGLFDVYEGKNLDANKKSYAVRFIFQDQEKTLQDQQIDGIMNKIREALEKELGAELR
jgi:phenylalanyl-tRNA synthetase beta chain